MNENEMLELVKNDPNSIINMENPSNKVIYAAIDKSADIIIRIPTEYLNDDIMMFAIKKKPHIAEFIEINDNIKNKISLIDTYNVVLDGTYDKVKAKDIQRYGFSSNFYKMFNENYLKAHNDLNGLIDLIKRSDYYTTYSVTVEDAIEHAREVYFKLHPRKSDRK